MKTLALPCVMFILSGITMGYGMDTKSETWIVGSAHAAILSIVLFAILGYRSSQKP